MDPKQFLAVVRKRLTTTVLSTGLARLTWILIAGVLAVIVLDRFQNLPAVIRLVILLAGVTGLGLVVWRRLVRPLGQELDDAALARIAERRLPALNGRLFALVDGLDLGREGLDDLRAYCTDARARSLICTDGLRTAAVGAAVAVMIMVVAVLWQGQVVATGLQRLILPFSAAEFEKSRQLEVALRTPVVAADQPMVVTARRLTGTPSRIRIHWQTTAGGTEERYPDGIRGPWQEALSLSPGTYSFTVDTEDANPVSVAGRVVARPALAALEVVVTPPAYTGREQQVLVGPSAVTVLAGSQVDVRFALRSSSAVHRREVGLMVGDAAVDLIETDGQWTGSFAATADAQMVIDLTDYYQAGDQLIPIQARPAVQIGLTAEDDAAPLVELLGVASNEQVSAGARLPITVHARDAIGLATLSLAAEVQATVVEEGGKPPAAESRELARFDDRISGQRDTRQQHELHVGSVAGEGHQIVLTGHATDGNDVDGPGKAVSDPVTLIVVSAEELRQELDRILVEARDRISQARDHLANGLSDNEQLTPSARSSRAIARRAGEQVAEVVRRWRANALDEDVLPKLDSTAGLVRESAVPKLGDAAENDDAEQARQQAQAGDAALSEAEATLTQLLRSGDLARQLHSLLKRQEQLNAATRDLVRKSVAEGLDATDERRLGDLGERQQEQAKRVREWERRLQGTDAKHFDQAREMAKETQPGGQLDEAARQLGEQGDPTKAPSHQQQATDALKKLLDSLRGGDQAARWAQRAGELAERQEQLTERLENGERPQDLKEEQERLREETEALQEEMSESDNEEAQQSLQGAANSQEQAEQNMQKGRSSQAGSASSAAASQLRQAQRSLAEESQQQDQEQQEQEDQKKGADVLGLLRALVADQTKVVSQASVLHESVLASLRKAKKSLSYQGKDLKFRQKRELNGIAELQEEVLLRVREEGIKHLDQMPIAAQALKRVEKAMDRSHAHLAKPNLGDRGVHLASVALKELKRLLDIVDSMPPQEQEEGGGQGEGGSGNQPPFPPRAQLALLKAAQQELSWLTAVRHPSDLTKQQAELAILADMVARQTRPGTRPHILMQRTIRAMASAIDLLERKRHGPVTRDEQDLAVALIHRLMEEAKAQGGGGGGSSSSQPRNNNQDQQGQQSQQSQADSSSGGSSGGSSAGQSQADGAGEPDSSVVTEVEKPIWLMELPLREQEQVLQAMRDEIPPEAYNLYRSYLERLQEGR